MVRLLNSLYLGASTLNSYGNAKDAVELLPLEYYLGSAVPSGGSYIDVILSGVSPLVLANAIADGLNYLKLFGGTEQLSETYIDSVTAEGKCEQTNLPEGYTQVEYLESSGTEYIDLGDVLDTSTDDIEIEMQLVQADAPTNFFGARANTTSSAYSLATLISDDVNYWRWGWKNVSNTSSVTVDLNKHILKIDHTNNTLSLDGIVIETKGSAVANIVTPTTPTLFAIHATTTQTLYLSPVRISAFRKWRNGELVQFVVACRRNSDNVLGMYDLVSNTFLTNAGSGTFTAGSDVVPSPTSPMDIVCNNGVIGWDSVNQQVTVTGTQETITDNAGNVATCQNLLSVGTYKDTQEILSGAVSRNVAIKVLDGTESWTNQLSTYQRVFFTLSDILTVSSRQKDFYCSHFKPTDDASESRAGYSFHSQDRIYFFVQQGITTVEEWQQWLATQYANGTPVIVVYPTRSATSETVTGQVLNKTPLTYAGSVSGLTGTAVTSTHTTPTPTQPLQINCNNGVVKLSPNLFDKSKALTDNTIWRNATGGQTTLANYYGVSPISVKGGHTYTRSGEHGGVNYFLLTNGTSYTVENSSATITVPNDAVSWVFNNKTSTSRDTMMVVEGSSLPAEYIPYGQIYTDGTTETVEVHGKNLYGGSYYAVNAASNTIYQPTAIQGDSWTTDGTKRGIAKIVPVKGNTKYTFSVKSLQVAQYLVISQYASIDDMSSISNALATNGGSSLSYTITTNANAKYVLVGAWAYPTPTAGQTMNITEPQFELGSTATTYEPYFNGGSATAEMLLKVGDYKDVQSVLDGAVTRNVGIKVFDGTENWSTGSAINPNRYTLAAAFNDLADLIDNNVGYSNCYTVISRSTSIQSSLQNNECGWNTTKVFCVRDDRIETLADWKQYLSDQYNSGNPVIVVYPLATATTESVTAQALTTQSGTNILEITQASMDDLTMEVSYKAPS